ncbi:glycosyltransferase [Thiobacter aerophilum]|uniref:Glycosyltransferase n=1 Tax=Thiobacter aerophilum TaxID=3121275 RepID=A0ABV0EFB1_9BURK
MRTCLLINNSPQPGRARLAKLGGGGMSLLGLMSKLPEYGWQPHVVVPGEGQFTEHARALGLPVEVYPFQPLTASRPLACALGTLHWYRLFRRVRPAIIHGNGFDLSRSFALAAGLAGIPYVTHVRFPVDEAGARWTLHGLPKPAAFIFNSQAMRDALWPLLQRMTPRSRPYVVHNAVDLERFPHAPLPATPPFRVGIVANFAPFKRHEDFLRMAAILLGHRTDLAFWIVGEDTEGTGRRAQLEQLTRSLGIEAHVQFLGHRTDIPDILRQLFVLIVPSQFEPFGRVVVEAMACGRPVIGSRSGGIPEIIEDGKTGFLRNVGDVHGFAEAVLTLLSNPTLWAQMSLNAAQCAHQRFALPAHTQAITAIYDEVLQARS